MTAKDLLITNKTKIGLFAVVGTIPFLVTGIFWITMIYFKVQAAEKIIDKHEQKFDSQMIVLIEIRDRLTRLEESQKIKR